MPLTITIGVKLLDIIEKFGSRVEDWQPDPEKMKNLMKLTKKELAEKVLKMEVTNAGNQGQTPQGVTHE